MKKRHYDGEDHTHPIDLTVILDDGHIRPKFLFHPSHPDYLAHFQQVRHLCNRLIPMPIGPSLPRRDQFKTKE